VAGVGGRVFPVGSNVAPHRRPTPAWMLQVPPQVIAPVGFDASGQFGNPVVTQPIGPPSLRALGTVVSTTTAAPSFAAPAGAVSTDVIQILFFCDDGRTTVSAVPSGFVVIPGLPQDNDVTLGSPAHSLRGYWAYFSVAGAGPYAFTLSTSVFVEGRTAAIQNADPTGNPFEATNGATSGATAVTTAPSVTATSLSTNRYAFNAATNWTGGAWTPPAGFTEQWDANSEVLTFDDKALPTAQTVTPQPVCAGSNKSNAWVGIFLPLQAAGTQIVAPVGIVTTERFGNSAIAPGAVTVSTLAISSAEAFGNVAVTISAIVTATGIDSTERFGNVTATSTIALLAITSAE
jgi:hypothetical protein